MVFGRILESVLHFFITEGHPHYGHVPWLLYLNSNIIQVYKLRINPNFLSNRYYSAEDWIGMCQSRM